MVGNRAGWFERLAEVARTLAVSLSFLFVFAVVAFAQSAPAAGQNAGNQNSANQNSANNERPQDEPGRFDFYVLALSWSPSYCAASAERAPNRAPDQQCGGRPFAFVVHGLWPQYDKGFPSFCQVPAPRLFRGIVEANLDLMPSPRLIFHEWDRHGTCSGLGAAAYFETVRKAFQAVAIPSEYADLDKPILVSAGDIGAAFVKANPGLTKTGMAVACTSQWLSEVRICLSKDLKFRDCPDVARRSCRRDGLRMPAVRGR